MSSLACVALFAWMAVVPQRTERFPLGSIGGEATVAAGVAAATVVKVVAEGPGARAGLREGDVVVGVGGVPFVAHTAAVDDGGNGPQRALGEAVDAVGDGGDEADVPVLARCNAALVARRRD